MDKRAFLKTAIEVLKYVLKTLTEVACTVHSYFIGYFRDIIFSFEE